LAIREKPDLHVKQLVSAVSLQVAQLVEQALHSPVFVALK